MILNCWANTLTESIYTIDQFVDDDIFVGLVDNTLTDLLPNAWYLEQFLNFTQLARLVVTIAACVESTEQTFVALVESYTYLEDLPPPICNMVAPWDIVRRARGAAVHLRATPARMPISIRRPPVRPPLAENLPVTPRFPPTVPSSGETILDISARTARKFGVIEGALGMIMVGSSLAMTVHIYRESSIAAEIKHRELVDIGVKHTDQLAMLAEQGRVTNVFLEKIATSGQSIPPEIKQGLSKDFDAAGVAAPVHKPAPISSITGNFNPKPGEIMPSTIESFDIEIDSFPIFFLFLML